MQADQQTLHLYLFVQSSLKSTANQNTVCKPITITALGITCPKLLTSNVYSDSMSQVTGRLFNLGGDLEEIDILAWPVMDTAARNPRYAFRLPVNEQGVSLSPKSTLLLRLYTIHAHDSQLVVVGNCLYEIFNDKVRRCIFC